MIFSRHLVFISFALLGWGVGDLFCLPQAYASRGYVAIAIDSRYHGERASSKTTYRDVCMLYLNFVFFCTQFKLFFPYDTFEFCNSFIWTMGS